MGQWGVRSSENDEANDALDAGFEEVHGSVYEDLMDDGNPLTPEQVQQKLANPQTLAASIASLERSVGLPPEEWDEVDRLGFAGIVVRHAELGVAIPDEWRNRAVGWLVEESIDWEEATARKLRRQKEIDLLTHA